MIKRIVVELDEKEHKKIKIKAAQQGKSLRDILKSLLEEWLGD